MDSSLRFQDLTLGDNGDNQFLDENNNNATSHMMMLPNELITKVIQWTDFGSREALRDVSKRLRYLVDKNEKSLSIELFSGPRRQSLDPNVFIRYSNLKSLDLTGILATSLKSTMNNTTQRNSFAGRVAKNCPLIEEMKITGIVGCKWLSTYVKSLKIECKIRLLHVDMKNAYIGCIEPLSKCMRLIQQLTELKLVCCAARITARAPGLTLKFFQSLGPRLRSLIVDFRFPDNFVEASIVLNLAGLRVLSVGLLSEAMCIYLNTKSPDLETLWFRVSDDTLYVLERYQNLQRLFLLLPESTFEDQMYLGTTLRRIRNLRVLYLFYPRIPGGLLPSIAGIRECSRLEVLIIKGQFWHSFESENQVIEEVVRLRNLKELVLPGWFTFPPSDSVLNAFNQGSFFPSLAAACSQLTRIETYSYSFLRNGNVFERHPSNKSLIFITKEELFQK